MHRWQARTEEGAETLSRTRPRRRLAPDRNAHDASRTGNAAAFDSRRGEAMESSTLHN
jgi:hypothetical protein